METGIGQQVMERVEQFRAFVQQRDDKHEEYMKTMRGDMMAQYEAVRIDMNARFEVLYSQLKTRMEMVYRRLDALEAKTKEAEAPPAVERVAELIAELPPGTVTTLANTWEEAT